MSPSSTPRRSNASKTCSPPAPPAEPGSASTTTTSKAACTAACVGGGCRKFSKGRYLYFFCLGQKNGGVSVCREPYVPADRLEDAVAKLYQRLQLPDSVGERLIADMQAEVVARQHRNASEREFQTRKLAKLDGERRKLLDAYYANAIDVTMLKAEQDRIGREVRAVEDRLAVRDGTIVEYDLRPPFDLLFCMPRFAYGSLVDLIDRCANREEPCLAPRAIVLDLDHADAPASL